MEVQGNSISGLPIVMNPEVPPRMKPTALRETRMVIDKSYGTGTTEAEAKDFRSRAEHGARQDSMEQTSTIWAILQMSTASTKPEVAERERERME